MFILGFKLWGLVLVVWNCSFGSGVFDDGIGIGICRYVLDVYIDRVEDVFMYKRFFEEVKVLEKWFVFYVCVV